jgi:hypothetical protein
MSDRSGTDLSTQDLSLFQNSGNSLRLFILKIVILSKDACGKNEQTKKVFRTVFITTRRHHAGACGGPEDGAGDRSDDRRDHPGNKQRESNLLPFSPLFPPDFII